MSEHGIDDIIRTLTEIAAAETGLPAERLGPDVELRGVEGVDSVRVLRMIAKVERRYDVELEDEDVFGATTIAQVAAVVDKALREMV
ncbi:acyl carrier protein [Thermocatellispora tengchongensis]|uniref:Acyl carrier protein n=1 Tax=Thermocatellispora tengchongensis TaxID=1073253 RepID=A0A840PI22_9ACTN|nr:acyl carrier protein [Thermocatellispora tengchongensis]MBB5139198.1 acyl carrier protein [Thermocatellispora tengchongensis]